MGKAAEEGEIWEWRGFGALSKRVASAVRANPIRSGLFCHQDFDIYLVPPRSNQNVKIRKSDDDWFLKFKLLLTVGPRQIELYRESANLMYAFPIKVETLREAARLLLTELPDSANQPGAVDRDRFVEVLAASSPPVRVVEVPKTRSQFVTQGGWIELAEVQFPAGKVQSMSIHSQKLEVVHRMLDELDPDAGLEAMNYVEACRRWGSE